MATPIPTYRYCRDPRAEVVSTWQDEPGRCELCGHEGPGYSGPFYGERDCDFVCERCLVGGALAEVDVSTNEGDVRALRAQLSGVPEPERERLVRERTDELAHRTPHLVTWQELAGGADLWRWFLEHVREPHDVGFTAEDLAPRASRRGEQWSLVVYHFRCTSCGRSVLHRDCD